MSLSTPLTTYLTTSCPHPLARATTAPFLTSAGQGTLPKPVLSQWLSQDRLYARSYIRFIGLLLSKIRLAAHSPDAASPSTKTTEERTVDLLIDALVNIRSELTFFESVAKEFGLDLTAVSPEDGMVLPRPHDEPEAAVAVGKEGNILRRCRREMSGAQCAVYVVFVRARRGGFEHKRGDIVRDERAR